MLKTALQSCCEKYGYKPVDPPRHAQHEEGKTYWCGYWQMYYTVLDENGGIVKCQWEDGKINKHCTSLDRYRDKELIIQ